MNNPSIVEFEEILKEDSLDEAMLRAQEYIGQTDGGICGTYWSDKDDSVWEEGTTEERRIHLKRYLALEVIYK